MEASLAPPPCPEKLSTEGFSQIIFAQFRMPVGKLILILLSSACVCASYACSCARADEQQPIDEGLRQVAAVLQGSGLVSGSAEELLGENFLFRSPSFWTADQRAW